MGVWLPVSAAGIDGAFAARKTSANGGDRTHSEPCQLGVAFPVTLGAVVPK